MQSIWQRLGAALGKRRLFKLLRFYPPFLGAGVRVTHVADDLRWVEVEMPLTPFNRNYVGTHFGGSLYSMCDPFFMLLLMMNLGPEYVVWDKSASIRFVKPGRGRVHACFEVSSQRIAAIRDQVDREGRAEPEFHAEVKDDSGEVIARVHKVLHVRLKDRGVERALEEKQPRVVRA
jgi:acyl-coenzyme A thioesterase PaaI-like protein